MTEANVMNKPAVQQDKQTPSQQPKPQAEDVPLTRDQIRAKLIGSTPESKSVMITLFGVELELKQPTLKAILKTRASDDDDAARAIGMIIEYAYVPGTNDLVFEDTDHEMIARWPFGEDLSKLNGAIAELTGIDIETAVKEMDEDPLGG